MSYSIKNSDGSILVTLPENEIDKVTTSITLIGKNIDSYGESLNTNFVNILQNFASNSQPRAPLVGQLWYDTLAQRLKIFSKTGVFNEIKPTTLGTIPYSGLEPGDIFIDTTSTQMYFTKDGVQLTLVGPNYNPQYGKSGIFTELIRDGSGTYFPLTKLYSNGRVIAVISTSSFSITGADADKAGGILSGQAGLTLSSNLPLEFNGTATAAKTVLSLNTLTDFMYTFADTITTGSIWIKNDIRMGIDPVFTRFPGAWPTTGSDPGGLYIGSNGVHPGGTPDLNIYVAGTVPNRLSIVHSLNQNQPLRFRQTTPSGDVDVITLLNDRVGINNISPQAELDVTGSVIISNTLTVNKDLIVNGTQTIINTVMLTVDDINIELAATTSPLSDAQINGGGITLRSSAVNKTFTYNNSLTAWMSNINLATTSGSSLYLGDTATLSRTSLGVDVIGSNLTRLGILEELTVTNVLVKPTGISNTSLSRVLIAFTATATSPNSAMTLQFAGPLPLVHPGLVVEVAGLTTTGDFNGVYTVKQVISNTSTVVTVQTSVTNTLSVTTAVIDSGSEVIINDLILDSGTGELDAANNKIRNVAYPLDLNDAANAQYVQDQFTIAALKGYVATVDITNMLAPNTEIEQLLNLLTPPVNVPTFEYPDDTKYNLPEGFRARVLCITHTIPLTAPPISLTKSFSAVMSYPGGSQVNVLQNVGATNVNTSTKATIVYTIKEFRVYNTPPLEWKWYRNIN